MLSRSLLPSMLLASSAFGQSSWLTWNAGCPEGSEPLVQFNGRWDELLTFDVELRGLLADTVTVDSQDFLRFSRSPGTVPSDVVGFPELPVVRRMVWLPDDSDITLEYSANCCDGVESLPVYPAPLDSLVSDSTCTPYIGEFFRKDSSAYASDEWYPEVQAELVGEFRLRDLRVGIVDVYPVQYLASEDSLRVWSDIEVGLSWDEGDAVWSQAGLGYYDNLIGDELLGYSPEPQSINDGTGSVVRVYANRLVDGPGYAPDYVILVAAGLDGAWVEDLADHRDDLNGFKVAIVRTDDVLECYGGEATVLTAGMIRDFTEDMWEWGSGPGDRPTYLLLIGDHDDPVYAGEAWFLPAHVTAVESGSLWEWANDSWYVLFDEERSSSSAPPDMMVGRLPARDTVGLDAMVGVIIDFESDAGWPPPSSLSWRRYLTRLSGQNKMGQASYTYDPWEPDAEWASAFAGWLGYGFDNLNCGDGDDEDEGDGSEVTASEWVDTLTEWFERGQQVAFYINHGETHMFSAGIQWEPDLPDSEVPNHMGIPDSVFDSFDAGGLGEGIQSHPHPFVIALSCLNGTFNHTLVQHEFTDPGDYVSSYHFNDDSLLPPVYDYHTDCLAEAWVKNPWNGAIGVFASSEASEIGKYDLIGSSILRAIFERGFTRQGDAICAGRLACLDQYSSPPGWSDELGRFNLMGDPAVDIGDRVRFRTRCDLVISPQDFVQNRYPTHKVLVQAATILQVGVRNAGAVESGGFDVELRVVCGNYDTLLTSTCAGLDPGEESVISFRWLKPTNLYPPLALTLSAVADPEHETPDGWWANNDASAEFEVIDFYPNETGWPIPVPGSIFSAPALGDVDGDDSLEIVIQAGNSFIVCADPEGSVRWVSDPFDLRPFNTDPSCRCEPALGSVCGDSLPEVVFFTCSGCFVLDGSTGEELYSRGHGDGVSGLMNVNPRSVVLADLVREGGQEGQRCEIAYAARDTLYVLRVQNNSLEALDRECLPEAMEEGAVFSTAWCVARDLDETFPAEIVVDCAWNTIMGSEKETSLLVYSYPDGCVIDSETWEDVLDWGMPAVGELAGQGLAIAQPRGVSDENNAPAYILDTSLALVDSCEKDPYRSSNHVRVCGMTDWDPQITGIDRIVAAPENMAYSWRSNGALDIHPNYPWTTGSLPPFFALGDLDGDEVYDMIVGRREGWVNAYNSGGAPLGSLEFPFTLPANVFGGFAIADIDGDENVEVVFGTSDNYLHVWDLADCDEGYVPWPQCQQNAARTGVLE